MANWPGYIPREDLIVFCQNEATILTSQNNQVWDAMQNGKLSDEEYETMFAKHYSNIGTILGLRKVAEWARQKAITFTVEGTQHAG